ncbi:MAG: succinate dehydrogenase assembly factor 2 [Alphaproteobacteria bacterium]|nr:succinate dehydrogenase assembly factor 2 [Alphaproteobacteria bacterium]
MADDDELRRKRARYRAQHRGMKEMDLILGQFCERALADLSPAELEEFERLLDVPDQALYDWLAGKSAAPIALETGLKDRLERFQFTAPTRP